MYDKKQDMKTALANYEKAKKRFERLKTKVEKNELKKAVLKDKCKERNRSATHNYMTITFLEVSSSPHPAPCSPT